MAFRRQMLEETQNNHGVFDGIPRFMLITYGPGNEKSMLKIPQKIITHIEETIPSNVVLQFGNGREVHIHYKKHVKCFSNLDPLYVELGGAFGFYLILTYKGSGIFFVDVIDKEYCGIECGANCRIAQSSDNVGGKTCQFLEYAVDPLYINGSITIPSSFLERFGKNIPESIRIRLVNGEIMQCEFMKNEGKIVGLLTVVQNKYVENWDILLFTYHGNGNFDLAIFDNSRTEKMLKFEVIDIESDSEIDSVIQDLTIDGVVEDDVDDFEDDRPIGIEFSKVLTWSNVNGSSHGVHIPVHVKPENREWIAGEIVTIRMLEEEWPVGIVLSGRKARFSSGWNKFCSDNQLVENQKLNFLLVEEIDGLVFNVD